jgi:NUMOD3 motif
MSIYCPLSEALGISFKPAGTLTYDPNEKIFDPEYMGNHGPLNAFYGKNHTEETKQIIREKRKLQKSSGWKWSEESRLKACQRKRPKHTDEHKRLISEKMSGRKKPIVTCPHCGREGGLPQMKQWHFDKCKEKL